MIQNAARSVVFLLVITSISCQQERTVEGSVGGTKLNPVCRINNGGVVSSSSCNNVNTTCNGDGTCTVGGLAGVVRNPPRLTTLDPAVGAQSRTFDVTIAGSGTSWSDKSTVDFGPEITINRITVSDDTTLVVSLTVAPQAVTGFRDVVVRDEPGGTEIIKGRFKVVSR